MREYPIKTIDGSIIKTSHIGVNHTASGILLNDIASSYNKEFDNEDEVYLENISNGLRPCIIGDIKEAYQILRDEIKTKIPHTIESYAECVQLTIMRYFGNSSNSRRRLSYFPTEKEINEKTKIGEVAVLAHKNMAMSVERAMLAQNLLVEIGIKSTFKASGILLNGQEENHAYNIVSYDGKYYIFDVTIPAINNDRISPLICEIPEEVYDAIIKPNQDIGYSVEVSYYNPLQDKEYNIIYDAGREAIYQNTKQKIK